MSGFWGGVEWLARELLRLGMIRFGRFRLASGLESPYYIDLRRLYSYPQIARGVTEGVAELVRRVGGDAVAGVATAGIPLAAYVAALKSIPMGYVRLEVKGHGTGSRVEGDLSGFKVVVLDDVVTTGSSMLRAVRALRAEGVDVIAAAVVIDREQGARRALEGEGVELLALARVTEVFEVLRREGLVSPEVYGEVIKYVRSFGGEDFK